MCNEGYSSNQRRAEVSFERFSSSDVYIYEHVGGFIECCGCWFVEWDSGEPFPQFKTPRLALQHLDLHERMGHNIGQARVSIEKEYPNLDIEIEPYVPDPEVAEARQARLKEIFEQHPPQQFRDKGNGE